VVRRAKDGTLGYYDGRDFVVAFMDNPEKEREVNVHEFGHFYSDKMGKFNSEIRKRIQRNVELYSMLSPLIYEFGFSYIESELMQRIEGWINKRVETDDAYALASREILNAFAIHFNLKMIEEFEPDRIKAVVDKLRSLKPQALSGLAISFYQDPVKYFPKVVRASYHTQNVTVNINGVSHSFTLSRGLNTLPRVTVDNVGSIDVEDQNMPKVEEKEFEDDMNSKEKVGSNGERGTLPPILAKWIKLFEDVFAPDAEEEDLEPQQVESNGTGFDFSELPKIKLTAPADEEQDNPKAQNIMFVIDTSGSVTSKPEVVAAIDNMIAHYGGLYRDLSRKNTDLNISIVAGTQRPVVLLNFQEWQQAGYARKKELLEEALGDIWEHPDGGVDTPELLDAVLDTNFPEDSGKDVTNTLVIIGDGDETGRLKGDPLKEYIRTFNARRMAKNPAMKTPVAVVHLGAALDDGGALMRDNYSCLAYVRENGESYLQALLKIVLKQTQSELDGDLSEEIADDDVGAATVSTQRAVTSHIVGNQVYSRSVGGVDVSKTKINSYGNNVEIDFSKVSFDANNLVGFTFEFIN
jgi:hypothetical protein